MAVGFERLQSPFGSQARRRQRRSKRRVLLGMDLGQLTKGLGHLEMLVFPAFAATASGLSPQTNAPCTPLRQAQLDRVPSPAEHPFSLAGVAAAVFHGHLGLKGAPLGTGHLRSGQAYIGNLVWGRGLQGSRGEGFHKHEITSRKRQTCSKTSSITGLNLMWAAFCLACLAALGCHRLLVCRRVAFLRLRDWCPFFLMAGGVLLADLC